MSLPATVLYREEQSKYALVLPVTFTTFIIENTFRPTSFNNGKPAPSMARAALAYKQIRLDDRYKMAGVYILTGRIDRDTEGDLAAELERLDYACKKAKWFVRDTRSIELAGDGFIAVTGLSPTSVEVEMTLIPIYLKTQGQLNQEVFW